MISASEATARLQEWADFFSPTGVDKYAELYAEDAVVKDCSIKTTYPGRAGVRAITREYMAAVSESIMLLRKVYVAPDHAVAQWTWTGVLSGRIPLLPPSAISGARFAVDGVAIFNFTDSGLISREEVYWNVADFMQQICPPNE
jgi:steroid delta-isomerase-like uncharacterized protein